jgi:hypothetical protein
VPNLEEMLARGECPACAGNGTAPPGSEWWGPERGNRCCACGGAGRIEGWTVAEWNLYVRCCEAAEAIERRSMEPANYEQR